MPVDWVTCNKLDAVLQFEVRTQKETVAENSGSGIRHNLTSNTFSLASRVHVSFDDNRSGGQPQRGQLAARQARGEQWRNGGGRERRRSVCFPPPCRQPDPPPATAAAPCRWPRGPDIAWGATQLADEGPPSLEDLGKKELVALLKEKGLPFSGRNKTELTKRLGNSSTSPKPKQ